MKLTQETLKRMIAESITQMTQMDLDKPDPNDNLFRIMDQVQDRALEMMGMTFRQITDDGDDFEFSKMSNEVVTARLQDIDGMAQELVQKFQNQKGTMFPDDELPTIGFRGNKKIITKGEQ